MLNKDDRVKIETLEGEVYYGVVVYTSEEGRHVGICRHDEEGIHGEFDKSWDIQKSDSLEQPSPLVTVPSTSSGDTIDTESSGPLK